MIVQNIVTLLVRFLERLFGSVDINLEAAEASYDTIFGYLSMVCYFLPMDTVTAILAVTIVLFNFRIIVSILKTLWGILPII